MWPEFQFFYSVDKVKLRWHIFLPKQAQMWWMKMMKMNCFCGMVDRRKALPYFQLEPLPVILTIARLQLATIWIWTCAEPELRLLWMKFCSSGNHYPTAPDSNICTNLLIINNFPFDTLICLKSLLWMFKLWRNNISIHLISFMTSFTIWV